MYNNRFYYLYARETPAEWSTILPGRHIVYTNNMVTPHIQTRENVDAL